MKGAVIWVAQAEALSEAVIRAAFPEAAGTTHPHIPAAVIVRRRVLLHAPARHPGATLRPHAPRRRHRREASAAGSTAPPGDPTRPL